MQSLKLDHELTKVRFLLFASLASILLSWLFLRFYALWLALCFQLCGFRIRWFWCFLSFQVVIASSCLNLAFTFYVICIQRSDAKSGSMHHLHPLAQSIEWNIEIDWHRRPWAIHGRCLHYESFPRKRSHNVQVTRASLCCFCFWRHRVSFFWSVWV